MTSQTLDVTAVVELARLAPSVHNTQPWSFRAHGDTVELWADETRHLRVLDPRRPPADDQLRGGAVPRAAGAPAAGLRPLGGAAARGRGVPLARIKAVAGAPVTAEEVVLERAARSRHMQRGAFEDRRVDPAAVDAVREATHAEGAWVRFLASSGDQIPVAVLLSRADELETSDEAYREELRAWTARPAQTRDGLTAEATSLGEGVRGSDLRLRDFSPRGTSRLRRPGRPCARCSCRPRWTAWRRRPWGRSSTSRGRGAGWRGELSLVGHPQMVLRLGHAPQGPPTPRRPTEELLT